MDSISSTPTPGGQNVVRKSIEQHSIQFQGFIFEVIVFTDQEISISFNQISTSKIHEANGIKLTNINYKTVLAALKKEHANVISASVKYNEENYSLNVQVKYDFLPPIVEVIKFVPRVISEKDMSDLQIKNYFNEIRILKQQIAKLSSCNVKVVPLKGVIEEVKVDFPKSDTIVTWSIEASSGLSSSVPVEFSYFNSLTNEKKPTNFIPNNIVSVHATSGVGSIQMRFLVKPIQGYDQLYFKFGQAINGKMLIIQQKV